MIISPGNLGRYVKGQTVVWKFSVLIGDAPTTLGGTPAVKGYEEGSTTEFTGGITLTADYDGKTGLCDMTVDTSDAAFTAGKHYDFVITAGTAGVGVISQVGAVVGHFALIPEPADLRMINGGATDGNNATLKLKQIDVQAATTGLSPINIIAKNDTTAVNIQGYDAIDLITTATDETGTALYLDGDYAFWAHGKTHEGLTIQGAADSGNGDAVKLTPGGTGKAVNATGQVFIDNSANDDIGLFIKGDPAIDAEGGTWLRGNPFVDAAGLLVEGRGVQPAVLFRTEADSTGDGIQVDIGGSGKSINAVVEGSVGVIESLRLANAANGGKISGGGTATEHIRDVNDTKDRIVSTVTSTGDRTAVTLNLG